MNKKVENGSKQVFRPAFKCGQHLKAGRNTQQPKTSFTFVWYLKITYLGNDGIGDCHRREPILMRKTSKVVPVIVRPDARQDLKTKVSEGLNTEQN